MEVRCADPCRITQPKVINALFSVYGGIQEFLSLSVFENSIRFAIDRNKMDAKLTREHWSSRMFDFFAGDLFEVFPSSTKFNAQQ